MKNLIKPPVIAVLAAVLLALGCQQHMQVSNRQPVAAAVTTPPPAAPKPVVQPTPALGRQNCLEATPGLVKLSKQMPKEVFLGQTFEYQLVLAAQDCVGVVVVTDEVPVGASYVKSEPAAEAEGERLVWRVASMDPGQTGTIRVWLKADKEGTLTSCATVTAIPRVCAATVVGKPMLSIDKSGPETAVLGSVVDYTILVANKGSAVTRNVVVTDIVPDGLQSIDGKKQISYEVGDLAPGQSKSITVPLKAVKRGNFCNVAAAASSNAGTVTNDACTTVLQPGLKIVKTGDKEQFLGRNAKYKIVVSNTGDTTLTNLTKWARPPPTPCA